jgi:hypothetical protein
MRIAIAALLLVLGLPAPASAQAAISACAGEHNVKYEDKRGNIGCRPMTRAELKERLRAARTALTNISPRALLAMSGSKAPISRGSAFSSTRETPRRS